MCSLKCMKRLLRNLKAVYAIFIKHCCSLPKTLITQWNNRKMNHNHQHHSMLDLSQPYKPLWALRPPTKSLVYHTARTPQHRTFPTPTSPRHSTSAKISYLLFQTKEKSPLKLVN